MGLVRQHSQQEKLFVKAAVADHDAVFVKGIGFTRCTRPTKLKDRNELAFGTNLQREHPHDLRGCGIF
tara:strand:- start:3233 stop:3436 length:204 start_codon:yes stop_codon:yes gene_type:complete